MLEELFESHEWDSTDFFNYNYLACLLKKDIGRHKAGAKIPMISVNFNTGEMVFVIDDDVQEKYKLTLTVGEVQ